MHSFNFINLDKDSQFLVVKFIVAKYTFLLLHYYYYLPCLGNEHAQFPTVLRYTTAQKYGRKAEQQKGCTQQTGINAVVGFFFSFFQVASL